MQEANSHYVNLGLVDRESESVPFNIVINFRAADRLIATIFDGNGDDEWRFIRLSDDIKNDFHSVGKGERNSVNFHRDLRVGAAVENALGYKVVALMEFKTNQ